MGHTHRGFPESLLLCPVSMLCNRLRGWRQECSFSGDFNRKTCLGGITPSGSGLMGSWRC